MILKTRNGDGTHAAALHARGKRLTRPRQVILDIVRASDAHPSAAAVYRQVRRRLPRVSLATVYRNLRMLAAEGLLTERADLAGLRFDGNTAPHDHFTCLVCRRIYDVPAARARGVPARVVSRRFEVLVQHVEFYGRCDACRRPGRLTRSPQPRRSHGRAKPEGDQELRALEGSVRR
jgi:Fur family ferric uptake transcriptional regulator